jgi:hypothetical protein
VRIECDGALRRVALPAVLDDELATDLGDGPGDAYPPAIEVDLVPAQLARLPATHAGAGDQQPEGVVPVVEGVGEERAELVDGPRLVAGSAAAGVTLRGRVRQVADVAAEVPACDRVLQCLAEHGVGVSHALGREARVASREVVYGAGLLASE